MANGRSRVVADTLAARPIFDHVLPLAAVALWYFPGKRFTPADLSTRVDFSTGVATTSALVLTAATFVCALTYQSANILMSNVRKQFAGTLKRNWASIILSAFFTAVLPVAAIAFDEVNTRIAFGVAIYSLALLICRALRSVFWLTYTLFMQDTSEAAPKPFQIPAPDNTSPQVRVRG